MKNLKIISADSAAAILDEQFKPILHVASVSVLVEPPYREPSFRLAEPIFREVDNGFDVIVHEAELCRCLLDKMKADVIHLDMSLGGISVEELSPVELTNLRASPRGRQNILKILPRLRKIAAEIKRLLWNRYVGYWQGECTCADCRVDGWCGSNLVCRSKGCG